MYRCTSLNTGVVVLLPLSCLNIIAFLYLDTYFSIDLQDINEEQFFFIGKILTIVKLVVVKILWIQGFT